MELKGWLKCYGSTTVGERGQVVLPAEARKLFKIEPGEKLIVLGADNMGFQRVILMKSESVTKIFEHLFNVDKLLKEGGIKGVEKALRETGLRKARKTTKGKKEINLMA